MKNSTTVPVHTKKLEKTEHKWRLYIQCTSPILLPLPLKSPTHVTKEYAHECSLVISLILALNVIYQLFSYLQNERDEERKLMCLVNKGASVQCTLCKQT